MIKIAYNRCQPWRFSKAECRLCIEACPVEGCMTFSGNTLSVDSALCIKCGICTTACPSGALELNGLSDAELLERLDASNAKDKVLYLGCTLGPDSANDRLLAALPPSETCFVKLPCLAMLKESHLSSLIISGVRGIGLDCSGCQQCSLSHGKKTIEKTVFYAQNLLSCIGYGEKIDILQEKLQERDRVSRGLRGKRGRDGKDIAPGPIYSRRELFSFFRDKAKEKAAESGLAASPGVERPKTDEDSNPRREVLLKAFKNLNAVPEGSLKDGDFPVRQLAIGNECTMCRRCEAFCPTGAIKKVEGDGGVSIGFRVGLCMGCFQCKEFCPTGAISYREKIGLRAILDENPVILMRKETALCASCGESYLTEVNGEGCPRCKKRKRLDDNIISMLFKNDRKNKQEKEAV